MDLCALHQSGAVCTKAANPETEAWRCRRRAGWTCFPFSGSTTVLLDIETTEKLLTVICRTVITPPGRFSDYLLRLSLGFFSAGEVRGVEEVRGAFKVYRKFDDGAELDFPDGTPI